MKVVWINEDDAGVFANLAAKRKHYLLGMLIHRATAYICAGEYHKQSARITESFQLFLSKLKRA